MREERGEYRPAHGNGCSAGKRVGKKKGTLSRHDIHLSILINLHNGDILWKIMRIDGIGGIPKIGKFLMKKFHKVGGKKKSINILKNGLLKIVKLMNENML